MYFPVYIISSLTSVDTTFRSWKFPQESMKRSGQGGNILASCSFLWYLDHGITFLRFNLVFLSNLPSRDKAGKLSFREPLLYFFGVEWIYVDHSPWGEVAPPAGGGLHPCFLCKHSTKHPPKLALISLQNVYSNIFSPSELHFHQFFPQAAIISGEHIKFIFHFIPSPNDYLYWTH